MTQTNWARRTGRRPNPAFDDEPQIAIERGTIQDDGMTVRKQGIFECRRSAVCECAAKAVTLTIVEHTRLVLLHCVVQPPACQELNSLPLFVRRSNGT